MRPGSTRYADARELCRRLAGVDVPEGASAFRDQVSLTKALASKLQSALDTIDELTDSNAQLIEGITRAAELVSSESTRTARRIADLQAQ